MTMEDDEVGILSHLLSQGRVSIPVHRVQDVGRVEPV
jgi:hypothetical protein